jgi:hypothetical protein
MHPTTTLPAPRAGRSPRRRAVPPSVGTGAGLKSVRAVFVADDDGVRPFRGFATLGGAGTCGVTRQVRRSSGRLGGGGTR